MTRPSKTFQAGNIGLQCGVTLRRAQVEYQTYGELNASADNAIVHPTWYGGRHTDVEWLIGPGRPLDTERFFVVVPNMFGNGLSSSPSNTPAPWDRGRFPKVSLYDNVMCQHRLLTEELGVKHIRLVTGWSMAAMQSFQWGCLFPEMVDAIAPSCGAARCSPHNAVMLDSLAAALTCDGAFAEGWYGEQPTRGIRAMARVYAGWGMSQAFYREAAYEQMGFSSVEDFVVTFWEGFMLSHDANDLLAMLTTWNGADISDNPVFGGDFEAALGAITSRAIVLPGETDLYFPPADSEYEVANMPNAELRVFPSIFGHFAAGSLNPEDIAHHEKAIRELVEGA